LNRFGLLPQNSQNINAEYGSSDFDVRHRFTFTTTYNIPGIKGFAQAFEGWQVNAIVSLQSAQPWMALDFSNDFATNASVNGYGFDQSYRWNFTGNPSNFKSGAVSIPYCTGPAVGTSGAACTQTSQIYGITTQALANSTAMWAQCQAAAASAANLAAFGCFVSGNAVATPPAMGTFGDMGRNIFRDDGFKNVDFSVFKNFTFRERYTAQFRLEMFNIFNHPIPANPYGASNGNNAGNDISGGSSFGGSASTPDFAAGNPIVGSGSARDVQIGLKLTF
jgi:hypothetical protein